MPGCQVRACDSSLLPHLNKLFCVFFFAEPDPRTQSKRSAQSAQGVVSPCDRSPSRLGYELPLQRRGRLLGAGKKPQSALVVVEGVARESRCCGFAWFESQDPAIDRRLGLSGVKTWFLDDRLLRSLRREWPTLGAVVIRPGKRPRGQNHKQTQRRPSVPSKRLQHTHTHGTSHRTPYLQHDAQQVLLYFVPS